MTHATHIGPFARMESFVSNKAISFKETLLTDTANVGSLAGVNSHVNVQVVFSTDGFLANSADEQHLPCTLFYKSSLVVMLFTGQAGAKLLLKLYFPAVNGKNPCVARTLVADADGRSSLHCNVSTIL